MRLNQRIAIIDYGIGNIFSILNSINYLGYRNVILTNKELDLKKSDVLILPGVGAFDEAIKTIKEKNLHHILNELVLVQKKNILGICVGMQMLSEGSYENGWNEGLNWIEGKVKKLDLGENFTVPHVGWNNISVKSENPLFSNMDAIEPHFYFDHSYHFDTTIDNISSICEYGINIVSSVQKDNIYGVQFHPEKSQKNGLKLFRSFFNSI
jgi:glutamine amidotransferase